MKGWEQVSKGVGEYSEHNLPLLFAFGGPPTEFYRAPDNPLEEMIRSLSPPTLVYLYAARVRARELKPWACRVPRRDEELNWHRAASSNSVFHVLQPFRQYYADWIRNGEVWRRPWGAISYSDRYLFTDLIIRDACKLARKVWAEDTLKGNLAHLDGWVTDRIPTGGTRPPSRLLVNPYEYVLGRLTQLRRVKWGSDRGWEPLPGSPVNADLVCADLDEVVGRVHWDVSRGWAMRE